MYVAEDTLDLVAVWQRSVDSLAEGALSPQNKAWIQLTRPLGLVEDTALLAAPNEFTKDLLDSRYRPLIAEALSGQLGRQIRVAVTVEPLPEDTATADTVVELPPAAHAAEPTSLPAQGTGRDAHTRSGDR